MTLWQLIQEPLSHEFMRQAFELAALLSATCALLSCFLVFKGWSLMGDGISHAMLPGVVVAAAIGLPLTLGAFLTGMTCALASGYLTQHSRIKEDTALGVVFSGLFALGIVLFHYLKSDHQLMHILLGNLLGIQLNDRIRILIIASIVIFIIALKWKDLSLYVFDPIQAKVTGLSIQLLHNLLLILLALTAIAAINAVGVILVVALLIIPGMTAQLLCRRFSTLLITSMTSAILATFLGVWISYHLDASPAACIVLSQTSFFLLALGLYIFRHQ
ncbi:metal ABC transporter permease [Suttonella ornithocola]|uniref:Manganese transport system membrane protein mntB n=1 Tax=Suttonella ornithocola TaxID=279832 RepID=A0A380MWE8_9GAMM|nr:metal ABC transporter permease [Suttonella ornithocola]SUO96895.1 Manganese transport system membrane protein mntB [Suttonella ornithocola]